MAEKETVILDINVDAAEASKALDEVNSQLAELEKKRKTQEGLTQSEEQELKRLQREQKNLNKVIGSQKGSYDQLSAAYSRNKSVLNAMSKEQRYNTEEGKKLEAETRALYAQMNEMQKATGKYVLQVGNYRIALNDLKGTIKETATGFLNMAKAILANPIGAVVAALVLAFKGLVSVLKSSTDGQMKLAKATGYLKGVLNGLKETLVQAGELIGSLFTGDWEGIKRNARELKDAFLNIGDVAKETAKVEEARKRLELTQSQWQVEKAQLEKQRAEAERMARKTEENTNARRQALERIANIDEVIFKKELAFLDEQIKNQETLMSLTSNTIEDEQALNELKVQKLQLETEWINKQMQSDKIATRINNAEKKGAKDETDVQKEKITLIQTQIALLKSQLALKEKNSVEAYQLEKDLAKKEYDLAIANGEAKETAENNLKAKLKDIEAKYQAVVEENARKVKDLQKSVADYTLDEEKRKYQAIEDEAQGYYDKIKDLQQQGLINEQTASDMAVAIKEEETKRKKALDDEAKKHAEENAKKELQAKVGIESQYAQATTSIMGDVADMQNEASKEGFERAKRFRIGEATINMLNGIVGAFTSAFTSPEPENVYAKIGLAAANAASVVSTGMSNINKIKQTQFGGSSSASSGSSSLSRTTSKVNDTIIQKNTSNAIPKSEIPQSVLVVDEVTAKQMQISQAQKIAVQ